MRRASGILSDMGILRQSTAAFTPAIWPQVPTGDGKAMGREMIMPGLGYCLKTSGGPPVRFALRSTVTSTLSPMWTKGMPLFIP